MINRLEIIGIILWVIFLFGGTALTIFGGTRDCIAALVIGIVLMIIWLVITFIIKFKIDYKINKEKNDAKNRKQQKINQILNVTPGEIEIIETKQITNLTTKELLKLILSKHYGNNNIVSNCKNIIESNFDIIEPDFTI